jgi:hypothetical protein
LKSGARDALTAMPEKERPPLRKRARRAGPAASTSASVEAATGWSEAVPASGAPVSKSLSISPTTGLSEACQHVRGSVACQYVRGSEACQFVQQPRFSSRHRDGDTQYHTTWREATVPVRPRLGWGSSDVQVCFVSQLSKATSLMRACYIYSLQRTRAFE